MASKESTPMTASREETIQQMFERLAPRYDLYNRCISLYLDEYWRRKAVSHITTNGKVLDLATGTGEMIFKLLQRNTWEGEAIGIDISSTMLHIAHQKLHQLTLQPHQRVQFLRGKARALPVVSNSVDYVMSAFVMRNVIDHLDLALQEMWRILTPGGLVIILEMSKPRFRLLRQLYILYMKTIFPLHGWLLYQEKTPFVYLKDSIVSFFEPEEFGKKMEEAGFTAVRFSPLTLGFVGIHTGRKPYTGPRSLDYPNQRLRRL
jgi:demethylmenaquinone methyltransferase/2-methoxy-6-polyprenyl-1,4-benzoquinol methylase